MTIEMDAKELKALKKQYKAAVLARSPGVVDMEEMLSPFELAAKVLPFNFR